jgi:hypothetical protein
VQTEIDDDFEMKILDSWVKLKPHPRVHIILGQIDPPTDRQTLTYDSALMAFDRPGLNSKILTRGTKSTTGFTKGPAFDESNAGLIISPTSKKSPRDTGVTLFAKYPLSLDLVNIKVYGGIYDGINVPGKDTFRYTGRLQLNLYDSESEYHHFSTYLGNKKTISLGAAIDHQEDVATGTDYHLYSYDFFADLPVGPGGFLSFEAGYINLELFGFDPNAEGQGGYAQAGYFWNRWQPWIEGEIWYDDGNDEGNYYLARIGLSYYIKEHNANIKAGYEYFKANNNFTSNGISLSDDTVNTFAIGFYASY